ncbi:MAG: XdhC family protein, partial [Dokdonella sp.]|nr:XdhC family protein [Dokdonella sp.]
MDERMFAQLANWLRDGPVVVCSVGQTQGATPRKSGSRMLVSSASTSGSIGG